MNRVLVLGPCGSGKSTLARALGERTGLPVIHLDKERFGPGWVDPDDETWSRRVESLAARPSWVMDGNYSDTLHFRLPRADTAIVLDFPTALCFWRVLKRVAINYGRTRFDMAEGCREHLSFEFLWFVLRFRANRWPASLAALRGFDGTKVFLNSPADVRSYLETFEK